MLKIKSYMKSESGDTGLYAIAMMFSLFCFVLALSMQVDEDHKKNLEKDVTSSLQKVYDQQYLDMKKYNTFVGTDEFAQRNPLFKTEGTTRLYVWSSDNEFCAVAFNNADTEEPQDSSTLVARGLNLKAVKVYSVDQKQKFEEYGSGKDSTNGGCATKIPPFTPDASYFDSTGFHTAAQ